VDSTCDCVRHVTVCAQSHVLSASQILTRLSSRTKPSSIQLHLVMHIVLQVPPRLVFDQNGGEHSCDGEMFLKSAGAKSGISRVDLQKQLGDDGATRLAGVLMAASRPLLTKLDIR
jgi:hypothetical protein